MHLQIRDLVRVSQASGDWVLPSLPADIPYASVTDLLGKFSELESALLPNSRRAITDINKMLRQHVHIEPCATTRERQLYSRVGLTVDRAALFLSGIDIVHQPRAFLAQHRGTAASLARLLAVWSPRPKGLFNNRAAIGWLYVLGGLDSYRRGFGTIADIVNHPLPERPTTQTAEQWFGHAVTSDTADEIVSLLRSLKAIRIRGKISPNPTFGGTSLITGSDGDWVVDDTLVELKCVNDVKKRNVAQLICYYALSQLPDRRHTLPSFSRLALCLPRQSCTIIGTTDEWLSAFGAPESGRVVAALHQCFDPHSLCRRRD